MQESVEISDSKPELTIEEVKGRTVKGVAILLGRNFILQPINLIALALFSALLETSQYGAYLLATAVIGFLTYFSDIGFAASLIQKKEKLTEEELRTVFTAQQILILLVITFAVLVTPLIKNIYNLQDDAVYLLWALAFSLFLSSLKVIPSVIMERKLEFNKLIIPQIVETIVFNAVALLLAWKGFGITSFTIAVIVRGVVGLIITYAIQPWKIGFSFSFSSLKSILKFGVPYQANTLMAMVKDDGMTLFLGSILGTSGIGLLAWAQKWAFAPLRFFMDQIIKVTFPAFSRLQDNKKELSDAVSKSILYICLLVFPALAMLVILAPSLIVTIPKYNKWEPALFALSILTISSALAAITTPITNALNAIGKISVTFKLMIMWTALTWAFIPILSINYGVSGAAVGFVLVGLSSIIALIIASKHIQINYLYVLGKPILVTCVLSLVVLITRLLMPISSLQVMTMITVGLITYFVLISMVEPKILNLLKRKNA